MTDPASLRPTTEDDLRFGRSSVAYQPSGPPLVAPPPQPVQVTE